MTEKAMPPSRRPATPSTLGWGVHGAGHPEQVLLGATQFSNEPEAHFGDLFPLPLPTDFGYPGRIEDLGSRRSQQRVAKRRSLLGKERSTVEALNCMAGFNDRGSWPCFPKNAAQWSALEHVHASHQSRAPAPFQESGQAALRQLLKKKAGSGYATSTESEGPGQLASYVRDRLSLPRGQHEPVPLLDILPDKERHQLLSFADEMQLSSEEMAAVQEKGFHGDCFVDPVLEHDPKKYHGLIADLVNCNILGFTTTPRVQVGLFMVTKKAGKQRLIVDARRTNKLFRTPPTTILGSVEAWSRLEVEEQSEVFVAQEDVKDFFYRLGISRELGEYFALPPVDIEMLKSELGDIPSELKHLADNHIGPYYPFMKVLPMGFSWAFHLAHQAHVELARRCRPLVPHVRDRQPAPKLGGGRDGQNTAMLIYADNNNHLGVERDAVSLDQQIMLDTLRKVGLDTHDLTDSSTLAESLGVRINGASGLVQPTPTRDWRLDRALWALCTRPSITGEQLQVIVGHMTVRALLHRGLMGILRHSYVFIEECYEKRTRLWGSVVNELWMFRHLMPLATANMRSVWDGQMLCTDACLSGYAVMESNLSSEASATAGRYDERWRFRREDGSRVAPREKALDTSRVFDSIDTVIPEVSGEVFGDVEMVDNFPEVDPCFLDASHWHLLWASPIRHREPVHLIEARSVLGAVKHRCRDRNRHHKRLVILNDNMGVVLAVQKGRCSSYPLLRLLRRISAHSLATGIKVVTRWVPSERNVADTASRRWEKKGRNERSDSCKFSKEGEEGRGRLQQRASEVVQCKDAQPHSRENAEEEEGTFTIQRSCPGKRDTGEHRVESFDKVCKTEEAEGEAKTEALCSKNESDKRGIEHLGNQECQGPPEERLLEEARRVLRFHQPSRDRHQGRSQIRRSSVRVQRSHVSEWRKQQLGAKAKGSPGILPSGKCEEGRASSPTLQASFERLEAHGSYTDSSPHDRIYQRSNHWSHAIPEPSRHGPLQRVDFLDLRPSGRDAEGPGGGCDSEEPTVPSRCHSSSTFRKRGGEQDWCVRRGPHLRRCAHALPRGAGGSTGQESHSSGRRGSSPLDFQCKTVPGRLEKLRDDFGLGGDCGVTLPESPRRCFKGSSTAVAKCGSHPEARSMVQRQFSQDLRQAGQTAATYQQSQWRAGALRRKHENAFQKLVPRWEGGSAKKSERENSTVFQVERFLSLFGGVGNPAKFWCQMGGTAAVIDLADSSQNDLGKHSCWNDVDKNLHAFDVVGIDMPCNTWSRARRAPWWSRMPKPLRKAGEYIFGLPWLSELDRIKVNKANIMLKRAVKVIRKCLKLGKSGYLENPMSSMIWQTPQIQRLLRDSRVKLCPLEMCMYNTQWKKPTFILLWNAPATNFLRCTGRRVCTRTGKSHMQLTGISGKRFLTEQAQVYSKEFSKALMLTFLHDPKTHPP